MSATSENAGDLERQCRAGSHPAILSRSSGLLVLTRYGVGDILEAGLVIVA